MGLTDTIQLTASTYTILQSDFIKILGIIYTKTFDNTKNLNTIISKVTHRLNTITSIMKVAPLKTKVIVTTSLLISIMRYGAGRMTTLTDAQTSKINSLMLRISWNILGKPRAMVNFFNFTNAQCDSVRQVRTPSIKF